MVRRIAGSPPGGEAEAPWTVQIALLRGVMPTGRTRVPMAELRELLRSLGFSQVRTLHATGNAIFRSTTHQGADLEALLEQEIAKHIGPKLEVMVRNAHAWSRIVASNPFPEASAVMPGRVLATVFKTPPDPAQGRAFEALVAPPERAKMVGDVVWLVHPEGVSASALKPADWRAAFGRFTATARNWNTVQKIEAAAQAIGKGAGSVRSAPSL